MQPKVHWSIDPALSSELVREILCLVQGLDGKYINFHPGEPLKITATGRCAKLDANLVYFLKRVSSVGISYRVVKQFSQDFVDNNESDLVRYAFGQALSEQLNEHIRVLTELHPHWTRTGLFALYACLMDQMLAKLKYLRFACRLVEHKQGTQLLDNLYDLVPHGDADIQSCIQ